MLPLFQVDAFTNTPFAGNPAAVCLLAEPRDDAWMQNVAQEMNLAETAFVSGQGNEFDLRWFTPAVEVDLCGHATLASAHVLWETGRVEPQETIGFQTRSGLLTARRTEDWIELDFPATPAEPCEEWGDLADALGMTPVSVGRSPFDYLVEVDSEATVRRLAPDFARLKALPVRGVIVTSRADSTEYDIISRFFAPAVGIDEDPVTGSAHCCLAPFWCSRLHTNRLMAYQASSRGGTLRLEIQGERVKLSGQAVTILSGEIAV